MRLSTFYPSSSFLTTSPRIEHLTPSESGLVFHRNFRTWNRRVWDVWESDDLLSDLGFVVARGDEHARTGWGIYSRQKPRLWTHLLSPLKTTRASQASSPFSHHVLPGGGLPRMNTMYVDPTPLSPLLHPLPPAFRGSRFRRGVLLEVIELTREFRWWYQVYPRHQTTRAIYLSE